MSCLLAESPAHKILPGKPENSFGIPHSNQSLLTGITLVYSNPENTGRCLFNWSFRLLHKFDSRMQVEIFDHKIEPSRVLAYGFFFLLVPSHILGPWDLLTVMAKHGQGIGSGSQSTGGHPVRCAELSPSGPLLATSVENDGCSRCRGISTGGEVHSHLVRFRCRYLPTKPQQVFVTRGLLGSVNLRVVVD